jgi:hypothetical protein
LEKGTGFEGLGALFLDQAALEKELSLHSSGRQIAKYLSPQQLDFSSWPEGGLFFKVCEAG